MKHLLFIAVLILFFAGCKKNTRDELNPTTPYGFETPANNHIQPVPPYEWSSLAVPLNNPNNDPDTRIGVISVNGKVFCFIGYSNSNPHKLNTITKRWEPFTDFPLVSTGYLFSYGSKIFYGLSGQSVISTAFESLDINTGVRTQLPDFPGTPVTHESHFVIGDKGYIAGGITRDEQMSSQLWEFNFLTNQWTNRGTSPLGNRGSATVMVVDGKAYMGLGFTFILVDGLPKQIYKNDWVRWDPSSSSFLVLAPFPGIKRSGARGFVLNNLPYVGFGVNSSNYYTDLWRYNVSSNTWTQQTSWPGVVSTSNNTGFFSIGNTGYLVKGGLSQFWKFSNSLF